MSTPVTENPISGRVLTLPTTLRVDGELTLEAVGADDAEELFALTDSQRDYLRQWLPWVDKTQTVQDTRAFIDQTLAQHRERKGFHCIIRKEALLCGAIGFHEIDWANRSTSIGYLLFSQYQGGGIMTRSCRALVHFARTELKLNRIVIRCAVGNDRSRRVPERLGFRLEGIQREAEWLNGQFVDLAVYSLLSSEELK